MTLLSGDVRLMRIIAGFPGYEASNDIGVLTTAIFSVFAGCFFGNFDSHRLTLSAAKM